MLLSQPVFASLFGLVLGIGLLLASRMSFKQMNAEDPMRGLVIVATSLFARLAAVVAILFVYNRFFPEGFVPFALSFAFGFLALYTIELVRYAGLHRYARPVAGPRDGR